MLEQLGQLQQLVQPELGLDEVGLRGQDSPAPWVGDWPTERGLGIGQHAFSG